jgi:hypothetical protein
MANRLKSGKLSKLTVRQAEEALALLFPNVRCIVAPNGSNEIWVKDAQGYGFALTLGSGKAGVSATIRKFTGAPAVSITGNKTGDMECLPQVDMFEVSATVYRIDEYSQQFKRWYGADVEQREQDTLAIVDATKPYKVRARCGHIVIRRMREATAGVPFSETVVLDAPNGRECDECEAKDGFTPKERGF